MRATTLGSRANTDAKPLFQRDVAFAQEFTTLCHTAAHVLASAESDATSLAISEKDIARDVLLNCGGLGHAPEPMSLALADCERSLVRISRRRQIVDPSYLAQRCATELRSTVIKEVDETSALSLHRGLHYLGMPRPGSHHLGLYPRKQEGSPRHLMCLVSLSRFDLHHLIPRVVTAQEVDQTVVLSRVLTLPGTPKNSVSRTLGSVFTWLRAHEPRVGTLLTYNNPNLGFAGTIYRATNWRMVCVDEKAPDLLLDGEYVSLREWRLRFGSVNYAYLRSKLQSRITLLPAPLRPLEVYRYQFSGTDQRVVTAA